MIILSTTDKKTNWLLYCRHTTW